MDSERARELLRRERGRIERALAGEAHAPDTELTTRDEHLGDLATELQDDELAEGLREQFAARLAAVKRAERRLALGTYGLSVESGVPIADDRLEVQPTAERTTEEQARLER
jgi:DnaK suppressor protein